VLIYPAYLTGEKPEPTKEQVAPELPLSTNTPPTFLAIAQDDPVRVENAVIYAMALKNLKVPMELHVYPTGGHGYGLRKSAHAVTSWPDRVQDWMRGRKIIP
jgi:acetyl esterase/lipase